MKMITCNGMHSENEKDLAHRSQTTHILIFEIQISLIIVCNDSHIEFEEIRLFDSSHHCDPKCLSVSL